MSKFKFYCRRRYLSLAVAVTAVALIIVPLQANASVAEIISLLQAITNTLQQQIGSALGMIQSTEKTISVTHQQIVWPVAGLNQARALARSMGAQYSPNLLAFRQLGIDGATLQDARNLESIVRSRNTNILGSATTSFANVFGRTPSPADASLFERNIMDMDDTLSLNSMKQTLASDQSTDRLLSLADTLEQQTSTTAPGTANYINAVAQLGAVQAQAQALKMLAAQLRVEAGMLSHENALLKRRAQNAGRLHENLSNMLTRPN